MELHRPPRLRQLPAAQPADAFPGNARSPGSRLSNANPTRQLCHCRLLRPAAARQGQLSRHLRGPCSQPCPRRATCRWLLGPGEGSPTVATCCTPPLARLLLLPGDCTDWPSRLTAGRGSLPLRASSWASSSLPRCLLSTPRQQERGVSAAGGAKSAHGRVPLATRLAARGFSSAEKPLDCCALKPGALPGGMLTRFTDATKLGGAANSEAGRVGTG